MVNWLDEICPGGPCGARNSLTYNRIPTRDLLVLRKVRVFYFYRGLISPLVLQSSKILGIPILSLQSCRCNHGPGYSGEL